MLIVGEMLIIASSSGRCKLSSSFSAYWLLALLRKCCSRKCTEMNLFDDSLSIECSNMQRDLVKYITVMPIIVVVVVVKQAQ